MQHTASLEKWEAKEMIESEILVLFAVAITIMMVGARLNKKNRD